LSSIDSARAKKSSFVFKFVVKSRAAEQQQQQHQYDKAVKQSAKKNETVDACSNS